MPSAPVAPQQGPNTAAGRNQAPLVPFPQASMHAMDQSLQFQVTPGVAPQTIGPADITPNGFLRFVDIAVSTVTAATGSPVGQPTWPWCLFQNIQFLDTGSQKMDDISGFQLYLDNYLSGSPFRGDPAVASDYSASATAPNFRLRLAREIFPDGKGSLPNLSGSQKYRIRLNIDALSNLYSTAPTAAPVLNINIIDHLWLLPAATDGAGREQQRQPELLGLAQYHKTIYPANSITNATISEIIKLNGTLLKYLIIVGYNSSGNLSDAVLPSTVTLQVDNNYPFSNVPIAEMFHYYESQVPERSARIPGVLAIPFNYGLHRTVGSNGVASWLSTSTATFMKFSGTQATPTTGTLDIILGEISTANINPQERAAMGSGTGVWQPAIPGTVQGGV